jgi:hypothetical protein
MLQQMIDTLNQMKDDLYALKQGYISGQLSLESVIDDISEKRGECAKMEAAIIAACEAEGQELWTRQTKGGNWKFTTKKQKRPGYFVHAHRFTPNPYWQGRVSWLS